MHWPVCPAGPSMSFLSSLLSSFFLARLMFSFEHSCLDRVQLGYLALAIVTNTKAFLTSRLWRSPIHCEGICSQHHLRGKCKEGDMNGKLSPGQSSAVARDCTVQFTHSRYQKLLKAPKVKRLQKSLCHGPDSCGLVGSSALA